MSGMLYIVGTPIGNLSDISERCKETLSAVDFIAAEDTRVTSKLLSRFNIKTPILSYHEHNKRKNGEIILSRIQAGESCAVVSDAGMPCISDPGEELVILCTENGVEMTVIPSPTALTSALAISGLPTKRFSFEGFLTVNKTGRREHLEEIGHYPHTMIFYEAPHKLVRTLADFLEHLGDRRIAVVRELTKIYEEVMRTTVSGALAHYETTAPKGEFVLVVEGYKKPDNNVSYTVYEAAELARIELENGASKTAAAKFAAKQTGVPRNDILKMISGERHGEEHE